MVAPPSPDLTEWLDGAGPTVGLVATDIIGSTSLVYDVGTVGWGRLLAAYRARADRLAADCGGIVLDRVGDGVLAAFRRSDSAYRFARGMFDDAGDARLTVRVGQHVGAVSRHDAGLVGRVLHYTERVKEHARGHEIWLSEAAKTAIEVEAPPGASSIAWVGSEECELKGIPGRQRLWRAG
jgi:class 3 adenylate cyclase